MSDRLSEVGVIDTEQTRGEYGLLRVELGKQGIGGLELGFQRVLHLAVAVVQCRNFIRETGAGRVILVQLHLNQPADRIAQLGELTVQASQSGGGSTDKGKSRAELCIR